jgi:rubrerythrin
MTDWGLSRRGALRIAAAGAAGGAATAFLGCGGGDDDQDTTETVSPERKRGDVAVLASLLDLERTAVISYEAVRARLEGRTRATADRFLTHERAHRRAVERAIVELGGRIAPPSPRREIESGFPPLRSAEDALRFAADVEQTQVDAYGDSLATLFTPELRVTVATIFAAQAEHLAVILGDLGEPQAPKAFLVGGPPEE